MSYMKKSKTAAFLFCGAALASQSAFGQYIANDLYMGFQNQAGGGTQDYIINLGAASGIVGSSSVVDLSSSFSAANFNAVLGASSSMFGGVVAGSNGNPPDLYVTQFRTGGAGTPSMPGSVSPATFYKGDLLGGYNDLAQLVTVAPAPGAGVLDSTKAWENYVEPKFTIGTFLGDTGINPDSTVAPGTVLYEDLWFDSNNSNITKKSFTYAGYFTLDLTGVVVGSVVQPVLTFTPAAVPEPSMLGLLGGAGLLLLSFRRRLGGKNA